MAIAGFKPVLGGLTLGTAGFSLPGDNAGFCDAILRKTAGSQPARLESLTYILPGQEQEAGGGGNQSPVVVNLLMQLRASCSQNNIFLRTGQASQAQIMAQLRQALTRSGQAVRAQAGEIERAVRNSLFQENEFRQALARLEREVKKNGGKPGQAGPLTRAGPAAAPPEPWAVRRGVGSSAQIAGGRSQARNYWNGLTAMPPLDRMTVQDRARAGTAGRIMIQNRAQSGKAGQTAFQVGRWFVQSEKRGQMGTFGAPERQTSAHEKARQGADSVRAVVLVESAAQGQEAVPGRGMALRPETPPGHEAARLAGRHPREAEGPGNTLSLRKGQSERLPDVLSQRRKASKRFRQRSEARSGIKRTAEEPLKDPQPNRRLASENRQGSGDLPSSMPISPERKLEAHAEIRVEAVRAGGEERTGQTHTPSALYPLAAGFRMSIFPMLRIGKFPVSLRLGLNWRPAKELSALFSRNPGMDSEGRFAGKRPTPSGSALEWRQIAPASEDENLSGAELVLEKTAPHMPSPNGIISVIKNPAQKAMASGGTAREAFHTIQGQAVRELGCAEVSSGALGLEKAAGASRQVVSHLHRLIRRTIPADIRTAAVRYVSRGRGVASFPGEPESARSWSQTPEPLKPIFAGTAMPGILRQLALVSAGNAALHSLDWTVSAPLADLMPVPVGLSGSNLQAVRQSMSQNKRVRKTPAGILPEKAAAVSGRVEPDQRSAERRTLYQRLTAPGFAGAEKYGAVHPVPEPRALPGMAGEVLQRWLSAAQAAARAALVEQKSNIFHSRAFGPVERLRPHDGGNTRFDGDTAPAKIFRTPDRHTGQGGGRVFLPAFRPTAVPAQGGALTLGQPAAPAVRAQPGALTGGWFAASAVPKREPMENSASARFAPRFLWRTPAGAGERSFQPQKTLFRAGKIPLRVQSVQLRNVAETRITGNHLLQTRLVGIHADRVLARAEGRPVLPGLAHFARHLEPLEGTLPSMPSDVLPLGGSEKNGSQEGSPAMIFRSPAPAAPQNASAQEREGEAVLAAQAVPPERARAMNRAFSYSAPAGTGGSMETKSDALFEQRVQTAGQGAQEVNYNRLTEDILIRIERRLRAERRKFGL